MEYPKPLMSLSEMQVLGFSKNYLYQVLHSKYSAKFSMRAGTRNSKFMIDTAEFEKLRKRGII